ncbi:MAG: porin family protein [Prevotella sp.]|jgi:opacity protein-like surface antigen|nr:porin family protein [Prevotella sp.]MDO4934368.1 porin family protein [Prevotella sp.]
MKKFFTALMFAVALLTAAPSQAQVKFGLKGGLNVTDMSLSSEVLNESNKTGFFVGPTVKFTLPIVGLGIDASALYDQRDAKLKGEDGSENVSLRSINIPINVRYTFGMSSLAAIYLAAGPQFGYNIGDKNIFSDEDGNGFSLKKSNFSVNVGAGITLMSKFEIGATYNIACGKTGELNLIDAAGKQLSESTRMNSWQVSAAYYF